MLKVIMPSTYIRRRGTLRSLTGSFPSMYSRWCLKSPNVQSLSNTWITEWPQNQPVFHVWRPVVFNAETTCTFTSEIQQWSASTHIDINLAPVLNMTSGCSEDKSMHTYNSCIWQTLLMFMHTIAWCMYNVCINAVGFVPALAVFMHVLYEATVHVPSMNSDKDPLRHCTQISTIVHHYTDIASCHGKCYMHHCKCSHNRWINNSWLFLGCSVKLQCLYKPLGILLYNRILDPILF